jgi:hypothetical protein
VRYLLYGLLVETTLAVPTLEPFAGPGAADVDVRFGKAPEGAPADPGPVWYRAERESEGDRPALVIRRARGWLRLEYADGVAFTVRSDGARVGCTWPAALSLDDAATYLMGPVMGLILRLRGATCLHASAVEVGGAAVLVCGPGGAGKSTTAAALVARGHALLSDDISPLVETADAVRVQPGYPLVRLWPEAGRALYGGETALPRLTAGWDKRYRRMEAFCGTPLPLRTVYVMAGREEDRAPRVEPLPAGEAVLNLLANVYMGWLPDATARGRDLVRLGGVAARTRVVRLVPHKDPARIGELCARIEADAMEDG